MKKKKWLKWIFILPIVAVLLFAGIHAVKSREWNFNHFNMHKQTMVANQNQQVPFQNDKNFNNNQFHQGMGMHQDKWNHMERPHHERGFGGHFILPFLLSLASIIIGWILLKRSEHGPKKWIGLLLIGLGLLPVLPLLLIGLVIYWLLNKWKNKDTADSSNEFTPVQTSVQADYLDEWERNIHKEEK